MTKIGQSCGHLFMAFARLLAVVDARDGSSKPARVVYTTARGGQRQGKTTAVPFTCVSVTIHINSLEPLATYCYQGATVCRV